MNKSYIIYDKKEIGFVSKAIVNPERTTIEVNDDLRKAIMFSDQIKANALLKLLLLTTDDEFVLWEFGEVDTDVVKAIQ